MSATTFAPLSLRIGFAMCFIGHGAFGILQKHDWLTFFDRFGIGADQALALMPMVGSIDIALGVAALVLPIRAVFLYGALWCLFTAALRPIASQSAGEFFERAGNYGVPMALLALTAGQRWLQRIEEHDWSTRVGVSGARARTICVWTTVTLLAGHGWLALEGKPLLQQHLATIGLSAGYLQVMGAGELLLALLCAARPSRSLLIGIVVWKVASESLFIVAGAPIWEFIERGGSYVAPLIAASLMRHHAVRMPARAALTATATIAIMAAWIATASAQAPAELSSDLVTALQQGGYVVACRHAITDHTREDRTPVNFDDPSTQRVLSSEGEQQAIAIGKHIARLQIPIGSILASPFDRTKRSAELMFGRVETREALSSMARGKDAELRALMTDPVDAGTNRLVMTHQGMLYRSFRTLKQGSVGEGDCVVVRPGPTGADVIALVKAAAWADR